MTPAVKRLIFPLRAPRWQTLAFWPFTVIAAAIDGYHDAFFAALIPPGNPRRNDRARPEGRP